MPLNVSLSSFESQWSLRVCKNTSRSTVDNVRDEIYADQWPFGQLKGFINWPSHLLEYFQTVGVGTLTGEVQPPTPRQVGPWLIQHYSAQLKIENYKDYFSIPQHSALAKTTGTKPKKWIDLLLKFKSQINNHIDNSLDTDVLSSIITENKTFDFIM